MKHDNLKNTHSDECQFSSLLWNTSKELLSKTRLNLKKKGLFKLHKETELYFCFFSVMKIFKHTQRLRDWHNEPPIDIWVILFHLYPYLFPSPGLF